MEEAIKTLALIGGFVFIMHSIGIRGGEPGITPDPPPPYPDPHLPEDGPYMIIG